jgi:hypothetical protein
MSVITGYRVFVRTWWRLNSAWPNGLEAHPGRKTTLGHVTTEAEARAMCSEYNNSHEPGRLSRKAEYEDA